jgi:hypothetical protein
MGSMRNIAVNYLAEQLVVKSRSERGWGKEISSNLLGAELPRGNIIRERRISARRDVVSR